MATHSRILAWETSWTEEPGGLQSIGSQTVGQDSVTQLQQQQLPFCTRSRWMTNSLETLSNGEGN